MKLSKLMIMGAALSLIPVAAIADDAPLTKIYTCSELADDTARLACYDEAVGRVKEQQEAGEFATITRDEIETVQRDAFGFTLPSLPRLSLRRSPSAEGEQKTRIDEKGVLREVLLPIKSINRGPLDKLTITLENGQVWRQTDTKRVSVSRKRPPTEAIIKSAAMGSYRMKLDGGTAFRVARQK